MKHRAILTIVAALGALLGNASPGPDSAQIRLGAKAVEQAFDGSGATFTRPLENGRLLKFVTTNAMTVRGCTATLTSTIATTSYHRESGTPLRNSHVTIAGSFRFNQLTLLRRTDAGETGYRLHLFFQGPSTDRPVFTILVEGALAEPGEEPKKMSGDVWDERPVEIWFENAVSGKRAVQAMQNQYRFCGASAAAGE